ncbi:MAG: helix-hairpin-helix domain-containing protein [Candidatus Desulfofervidus sp.]|nr:helix-hairpin-helix domain-containing protein [Candidatus Desulfofervidus sp.]
MEKFRQGRKVRRVTMRKTKQIFVIVVALGFILFPISVIAGQKLNINTATIEQLQNLPGVGSHIAQEIINYRHEHGPFQKVEHITQVKGIGEKKFEKIKDLITVGEAK